MQHSLVQTIPVVNMIRLHHCYIGLLTRNESYNHVHRDLKHRNSEIGHFSRWDSTESICVYYNSVQCFRLCCTSVYTSVLVFHSFCFYVQRIDLVRVSGQWSLYSRQVNYSFADDYKCSKTIDDIQIRIDSAEEMERYGYSCADDDIGVMVDISYFPLLSALQTNLVYDCVGPGLLFSRCPIAYIRQLQAVSPGFVVVLGVRIENDTFLIDSVTFYPDTNDRR